MKDTNVLPANPYTEMLPEEMTSQFVVKPVHIVFTAMLLVAWGWLGTLIIR